MTWEPLGARGCPLGACPHQTQAAAAASNPRKAA